MNSQHHALGAAALLLPCQVFATRPLTVDDAWPVAPRHLEIEAGFKWNPLSQDRWFFDHALRFTAKFPTAAAHVGTGEYDFDLTYIASKDLSDQWNLHFNAGYTWIGDPPG